MPPSPLEENVQNQIEKLLAAAEQKSAGLLSPYNVREDIPPDMGLDEVIGLLHGSHNLQRPSGYNQGALSFVGGPFVQIIQDFTSHIDSRVLVSAETHHQEEEFGKTFKMLEENPDLMRILRDKGYGHMPDQIKFQLGSLAYVMLTGLHMDSYVGTVNGEAFAVGIVKKTGLVWKANGRDVAGLVAVESTVSPQYYGCILLETGVIQFSSFFHVHEGNLLSYHGLIVPPGVPIDLVPNGGGVLPGEYRIYTGSDFTNLREHHMDSLVKRTVLIKKVDIKVFEPFFSETLHAARKLSADEKLRVETYKVMSRCAEYAVMFANAYAQLQPAH